jgi:hypothetical protein
MHREESRRGTRGRLRHKKRGHFHGSGIEVADSPFLSLAQAGNSGGFSSHVVSHNRFSSLCVHLA